VKILAPAGQRKQKATDSARVPVGKEHTRLIGLRRGQESLFLTYDGYDARVYNAARTNENWEITETLTHVHSDRTDLAFP